MSELSRTKHSRAVEQMFSSIAPRYDLANTILSMGIHGSWRRKLLALVPQESMDGPALDLCTGTADLGIGLARRGIKQVIGLDFCLPMLSLASKKLSRINQSVLLGQGDALKLPIQSDSLSLVTVSFGVRNFEDLTKGLKEILRVLRPGGTLLILEFGQPSLPGWRTLYDFYSRRIMPLLGGAISGNREAYTYLPDTSAKFPCREDFLAQLESVGYLQSKYRSLTGGIAYIYSAKK